MTFLYTPSKSAPEWACLEKDCEPGSPTWASRLAPVVSWNGKPTRPASLLLAWKKAAWTRLLSGPTFSPSTLDAGLERWTASLRDSRAKTSAWRADVLASMESGRASSSTSSTLPTLAVRGSSFWRTSVASLLPPPPLWTKPKGLSKSGRPPESWENWPSAGGMRNGSLFQRPTWAPAMGGSGGSASRGGRWTTPQAHDVTERGSGQQPTAKAGNACLARDARTWPTPRGTDGTKGGPNQAGSKGDLMLPSAAAQWPTPAARDAKGANSEEHCTVTGGGRKHMDQLSNFVAHSLHLAQPILRGETSSPADHGSPQPSASKSSTTPRLLSRRLNPMFTENLMGWPLDWTSTHEHSASSAAETESWRSRLQQRLSCLFEGLE